MSDTPRTLLFLVRHGATDANLRRPYVLQGRGIDLPLNEVGRQQADCVRRLLQGERIAAAYASPLQRARETAEIIAQPHGLRALPIDSLSECDVGRWEGLDWEQIREQFPHEYADFQRDSSRHPYLGGESYGDVARRALPALEEILERHLGETVLVVAHNVVNRACIASILGLDLQFAKDVQQANGGVNIIRRQAGRTMLVTVNSLFHLEDDWRS